MGSVVVVRLICSGEGEEGLELWCLELGGFNIVGSERVYVEDGRGNGEDNCFKLEGVSDGWDLLEMTESRGAGNLDVDDSPGFRVFEFLDFSEGSLFLFIKFGGFSRSQST